MWILCTYRFNAIQTWDMFMCPSLHIGRYFISDLIEEIKGRKYFALQPWTSTQLFHTLPFNQEATHIVLIGFLYPFQDVSGEVITNYTSGGFGGGENRGGCTQGETKWQHMVAMAQGTCSSMCASYAKKK